MAEITPEIVHVERPYHVVFLDKMTGRTCLLLEGRDGNELYYIRHHAFSGNAYWTFYRNATSGDVTAIRDAVKVNREAVT